MIFKRDLPRRFHQSKLRMHPNPRVKKENLKKKKTNAKIMGSVHVVADAIREGNVVLQETNIILDRAYQRDYTGGEIHKELEPLNLEPKVISSALIFLADNPKKRGYCLVVLLRCGRTD
ncbi:hypothetical protein Tco_1276703 [Tanacetum coccineum]